MLPKISIIVPIYNVQEYIGECLTSLTQQTLHEIEIVLVDDCGTDNSITIAKTFAQRDSRIKIIHHPENHGLSAARNTGIQNSSAPFIMFVDSDDWVELDFCECMLKSIESHDACVAVCNTDVCYVDDSYHPNYGNFFKLKFSSPAEITPQIIDSTNECVWNKIFLRKIIEEHNIYFPTGINNEDVFWWRLYCLYAKKIVAVPDYLYHYRQHSGSIMSKINSKIGLQIDCLNIAKLYYQEVKNRKGTTSSELHYATNFFFNSCLTAFSRTEVNFHASVAKVIRDFVNQEKLTNPYFSSNSEKVFDLLQSLENSSHAGDTPPEISVLVAVYNVKPYLKDCLDSLLNQTAQNAEFIIVDDGSSDGSSEICDSYQERDSRFKVIHHPKNLGTLLARKSAIKAATGQFAIFVDGDDLLLRNDAIDQFIHVMNNDPSDIVGVTYDLLGGGIQQNQQTKHWLNHRGPSYLASSEEIIKNTFSFHHTMAWNLFSNCYRVKVLKKIVPHIPNIHLVFAEDALCSFLIGCFASSFNSIQTNPLTGYRLGVGITSSPLTLDNVRTRLNTELQIVHYIQKFLKAGNYSKTYFDCLNGTLNRLIRNALWRLEALSFQDRAKAFENVMEQGFRNETITYCSSHFVNKQVDFAKAVVSSKISPTEKAKKVETIGLLVHSLDKSEDLNRQIRSFSELGFQIVLLAEEICKEEKYDNHSYVLLPKSYDKGRAMCLSQAIDDKKIDIVLLHDASSNNLLFDLLTIKCSRAHSVVQRVEPITTCFCLKNHSMIPRAKELPYLYLHASLLVVQDQMDKAFFQNFGVSTKCIQSSSSADSQDAWENVFNELVNQPQTRELSEDQKNFQLFWDRQSSAFFNELNAAHHEIDKANREVNKWRKAAKFYKHPVNVLKCRLMSKIALTQKKRLHYKKKLDFPD